MKGLSKMEIDELYNLGDEVLDMLKEYAQAFRDQDAMPLTSNRPFVALHDDLQLELQRMGLNHQHLLERSQTATSGLITPN